MCDRNNSGSFILGALVGGVVGALTGMLSAPASGEETRRKIRQTGEHYVERGERAYDNAKDQAAEWEHEIVAKVDPVLRDAERKFKMTSAKLEGASKNLKLELMTKAEDLLKEVEQKLENEKEATRRKTFTGVK